MLDNAFFIRYHKPRKRTWDALNNITGGICSMKLYKKAAACLLTAAMAISMLTACGGGGNGGNGGGNTPSPLPNNPDQIVLPDPGDGEGGGAGGGEGTETKPTKTPIIDVNNSKLAQFSKKYAGATEFYVEMQEVDYKDGSAARSINGRAARKGENCYVSMTTLGKNNKQQLIETLMLKNKSTWDQYLLFRSSKAAVKSRSEDDMNLSLGALIANKQPTQMWSTEIKVGPTKYYAEVYKYYSYEYTTCFTADGKPVYQFVRDLREKQLNSATLYKTIQVGSGTSKGLCEIPADFKKYSFDFTKNTITDANDNVFTLEFQTNSEGKVTSVKVFDKNSNDVSDDFKWVEDFFKLRG